MVMSLWPRFLAHPMSVGLTIIVLPWLVYDVQMIRHNIYKNTF